ncbi:hypothetical protein [Aureivirga sp. CE67]|uniref:hypothetical protein n=1 Tax=Aureivirga sp. CE67 TaxID=1788983 RepID=UPI0018CA594A|nr:hypothetical protein [Aureivirga sp. CE67]
MHSLKDDIDYIQFCSSNSDLKTIKEKYVNTEIYEEVVHFLNWFYPEWKTRAGLGYWSPEFILDIIVENEQIFNNKDFERIDKLHHIYKYTSLAYLKSKENYKHVFKSWCLKKFYATKNDIVEYLSTENRKKMFKMFVNKVGKQVIYPL